jgi:hypothetical protein
MIATINLADWLGSLLNVETPGKFCECWRKRKSRLIGQ